MGIKKDFSDWPDPKRKTSFGHFGEESGSFGTEPLKVEVISEDLELVRGNRWQNFLNLFYYPIEADGGEEKNSTVKSGKG